MAGMGNIRSKNAPPPEDAIQYYIGSAYDNVKLVADNLTLILEVAAAILAGTLDDYLADTDIDSLAKLNALVLDATLGDASDFATAAQGVTADTALQPEDLDTFAELQALVADEQVLAESDINTLAKLNALVADAVLASQAYVDAAVAGLYDHKGSYDASTNTPDLDTSPSGVLKGDAYTVSVAGQFFTANVEAGDVLIANIDGASAENEWTIVNRNIDSTAFATAAQGAKADTALQPGEAATPAQGALADSALQPGDNISELNNDSGFTDDQTGSEIEALYEAQPDTNKFTDAEKTKLGTVEGGATADQSNAEIEAAYNIQVPAASQVEAEAGTEAAIRRFSPLRVAQAIAALGGGGGGGGMTALYKAANYTMSADELVYVDSAEGAYTIDLPATPNDGDKCFVWDCGDNASVNGITIDGNGSNITEADGTVDTSAYINMNGGRMEFLYVSADSTWIYSYVVQTVQSTAYSARINTQTGTSYTIQSSDNGKEILFTNALAIAVTLPDTLPLNFNCVISQAGAGVPTVTRSGTDTINGAATGVAPDAQWKGMYLAQFAAGEWMAKY